MMVFLLMEDILQRSKPRIDPGLQMPLFLKYRVESAALAALRRPLAPATV